MPMTVKDMTAATVVRAPSPPFFNSQRWLLTNATDDVASPPAPTPGRVSQ
jgi:hypothetical protein